LESVVTFSERQTLVFLSLRLKDLLGPVTRVKKRSEVAWRELRALESVVTFSERRRSMFIDEAKPHRRRAFVPNPCTSRPEFKNNYFAEM